MLVISTSPKISEAACSICWCESCLNDPDCTICEGVGLAAMAVLADQVSALFDAHKQFLMTIWTDILLPNLARMTEQLTAAAILPTTFVGTFFDAKHQLDTQTALDKLYIDAINDYQPSSTLCKLGTIRSDLAASDLKTKHTQTIMAKQSLERHLGRKGNMSISSGEDINNRFKHFANTYCNTQDNLGRAGRFCAGGIAERHNKDIDVTKTLFHPEGIELDMLDSDTTSDETDIFALSNNLFGHKIFTRPNRGAFEEAEDRDLNKRKYHRFRSLIAKKNVIENSYFAIASRKTAGSGFNNDYLHQIAEHLGLKPEERQRLVGNNPSYDTQMKFLTKRIYQSPNFVADLIDKPANVARQHAAMMSFELMQERESYKSLRRQEMLFAVMLDQLVKKRFEALNSELAVK